MGTPGKTEAATIPEPPPGRKLRTSQIRPPALRGQTIFALSAFSGFDTGKRSYG